jgi:DNA-binding NtrC family response regulator
MAEKSMNIWPLRTDHSILLVDDNTDVLVATGAFLTKEGLSVQMSTNGDEALRLIANDPKIDVLITDFAMPGLSGIDLIAQATQMSPGLRALLITGYPNADGLAELTPSTPYS